MSNAKASPYHDAPAGPVGYAFIVLFRPGPKMASPAAAGNGPRNQIKFNNDRPVPQSDIWRSWVARASRPHQSKSGRDARAPRGRNRNSAKRGQPLTLG